MKSISLYGKIRKDFGSSSANSMRKEGLVPCVLYGNELENIHFNAFINDFKSLIYTHKSHLVNLNIEGKKYQAILQDAQFHPLSDELLHADFLVVREDKPVKVDLPVTLEGLSIGVKNGGKLVKKSRKLRVQGLAKNIPDQVIVDVTDLKVGKFIKVKDLSHEHFDILNDPFTPVAYVMTARALKAAQDAFEEGLAEATAAAGVAAEAPVEAAAEGEGPGEEASEE